MSTLQELNAEDSGKLMKQPRHLQDLHKQFLSDKTEGLGGKMRKRRVKKWRKIDKLVIDGHTYDDTYDEDRIKIGNAFYPKMHIAQMMIEMALPKVLDQHYTPWVTVEENKRSFLPIEDPNRARLNQFARDSGIPEGTPDLETAAAFLNTWNEFHYENEKVDRKTTQYARGILQYGEYWRKDGYEDGPKDDLYHPRDIIQDPHAENPEQWRYLICQYRDTLGNVRRDYPEWGHLVRPQEDRNSNLKSTGDNKGSQHHRESRYRETSSSFNEHNIESSQIELSEYWVEDISEEPELAMRFIDNVEDLQEWREAGFDPEPVIGLNELTNINEILGWEVEAPTGEMIPTFPSGWRQIIVSQEFILDEGFDFKLPKGAGLPLHQAGYFKIDGTTHYKGLIDIVMDNIQIFNILFKNALEDVSAAGVDFWDTTLLKDSVKPKSGDEFASSRRKVFEYASKAVNGKQTVTRSPLESVSPGETSQSIMALIDASRTFIEWISGQYDPRSEQGGNRDQSGALVKELKDGSRERLGVVKESITDALVDMFTNWSYYAVTFDTTERQFNRDDLFGPQSLIFAPDVLGKFEWNFDIKIGNGVGLPRDPEDQAAFLDAYIAERMGMPKPLRDISVRLRKFPFGEKLIEAMDTAEAQIKADAQAAAQAEAGPDPTLEKIRVEGGKNLTQLLQQVGSDDEAIPSDVQLSIQALSQIYATGVADPQILNSISGIKLEPRIPGLVN